MAKKKQRKQQPAGATRKQANLSRREREAQRNILIFIGIVVVSVVAMILYGVIFAPKQAISIVNGDVITVETFQKRVLLTYYIQVAIQETPPESISKEQLASNTLATLVEDQIVLQLAEELGITVTEAEIDDEIRLQLGFLPLDASTIPTPFPTPIPVTPTVTSTLIYTLTPRPTIDDVTRTPIPITTPTQEGAAPVATGEAAEATPAATEPPTSTATLAPEATATATLETALATATAFPTPSDFEEELFAASYEYLLDIWKAVARMDEQDTRDFFAMNIYNSKVLDAVELDVPPTEERTLIGHIQVETEEEALALLEQIEAGESFEQLAADNSVDDFSAPKGGELGWFSDRDLEFSPEFVSAAFDEEIGTVVGPIEIEGRFHLVKVYARDVVELPENAIATRRVEAFQLYLAERQGLADVENNDNWQRFIPDLRLRTLPPQPTPFATITPAPTNTLTGSETPSPEPSATPTEE